jgi:hypothetical protein
MTEELRSYTELESRFLAIGFSSSHDATFMNKIAQAGSSIGNFFYIDQRQEGW